MSAGAVEGWGVVQSRERILISYLAAAVEFDCCNKLSNLCVSGTPVFRCLRKTYCIIVPIYYYIFRIKRKNSLLCVKAERTNIEKKDQ